MKLLQDRKVELNDIRTQTNDRRRKEIKCKEEMLKNENILTKLIGERNFVYWLDALNKVYNDIPDGTSDYKMATVRKQHRQPRRPKKHARNDCGKRHHLLLGAALYKIAEPVECHSPRYPRTQDTKNLSAGG